MSVSLPVRGDHEAKSVERLFFCRHCRRRLPRDLMVAEQKSRFGVSTSCRECWRGRERRHDLEINLGWIEHDNAPDPEPAVLLRDCLADSRRHGLSFEQAWREDLAFVLSCVSKGQWQWRAAFEDLKPAWKAAYERSDVPGGLPRALLTDAERF